MKNFLIISYLIVCSPSLLFAADHLTLLKKAGLSTQTKLSDTKIGAGLKEALRVGINKAVQLTSQKDGYYANEAIKILMPDSLKKTEPILRKVGMSQKMDEFILSMNRAAEKAAPAARDIFVNAITDMSIDDVQKIYNGPDTAATQYFQQKTKTKLIEAYRPIIQRAMGDYGVTKNYQALMEKVPFARNFNSLNIENHVVDRALNGLFKTLGDQEKAIRKDPSARVTSLLKEVFSKG